MFPVEVRAFDRGNEELRAIGVSSRIGHGQQIRFAMRINEGFIIKLPAVDRHTTGPITLRHVSALNHKVLDDPMEGTTSIMERLVAVTYGQEVVDLCGHQPVSQVGPNSDTTSL